MDFGKIFKDSSLVSTRVDDAYYISRWVNYLGKSYVEILM